MLGLQQEPPYEKPLPYFPAECQKQTPLHHADSRLQQALP